MANIKDLKKYIGYEFSSGCYTGDDYKSFQTKYINYLRTMCQNNHWQLVNVGRNHYCFSAFIKSAENKCVYRGHLPCFLLLAIKIPTKFLLICIILYILTYYRYNFVCIVNAVFF